MIDLKTLSLAPAHRLLVNSALIPEEAGTYLVFVDSRQPLLERCGYLEFDKALPASIDGFNLMYVGATGDNLRSRVMAHLYGNTRGSSLRMTLGVLLADELGLEPVGDPHRSYFEFGDGELRLTDWLRANTRIAWHVSDEPFVTEKELLRSLPIPLNITDRKRHAFSRYLMALRCVYAGRPRSATGRVSGAN